MSDEINYEINRELIEAAKDGDEQRCAYLIERGADDFNGALKKAVKYGHTDICRLFIDGADSLGLGQALNEAAWRGYTSLCETLIENGARDKDLALYNAGAGEHTEICRLLISNGANLYSAIRFAAKNPNVRWFLEELDDESDETEDFVE